MSLSRKYGRTFHFPFSPGTTSDDRINSNYWQDICQIPTIIHTEKLDGENNCLSKYGVFARSHAAPTTSAWTKSIRERWHLLKNDLGDYEIFGENLYAVHSIIYPNIEDHYFVFGVRENNHWLSWEETVFIAAAFDLQTVPVIETIKDLNDKTAFENHFRKLVDQPGYFGSIDIQTQRSCTMEGIVTRNVDEYSVDDFQKNVFKYVRKGHVKTDEHWTRNWKRASLKFEKNVDNK
ncbi:MAG: RNA ligase family protein [Chitinophagaceae bacterium]|nr:RNA ligase family protein [Chitinophagaceae bacterium]